MLFSIRTVSRSDWIQGFCAHEPRKCLLEPKRSWFDKVNIEDCGYTEKVFRGVSSKAAKFAYLSHLEWRDFEFAQYLAAPVGNFERAGEVLQSLAG